MTQQPSLHDLIQQIERLDRRQNEALEKLREEVRHVRHGLVRVEREILSVIARLDRLEEFVGINEVISFRITQGDTMAIQGIAPGSTGTFTATPLDSNGNPVPLPAGAQPPQWTSSDPTNAPVTAAADGLSATVSVPSTTAGGSFTLSVSSPDLPGSPSGSAPVPINVPAVTVASFRIDQQA